MTEEAVSAAIAPQEPVAPEVTDAEMTVERIMDAFSGYRMWRQSHEDPKWRAFYRAYRGYKQQGQNPYKNNLTLREIFRQIETQVPQIAEQLLGQERNFRYKARQEEGELDSMGATEIVASEIAAGKMMLELYMWIHTTQIYGTAYMWPTWEKFRHTQYKIDPLYEENDPEKRWKSESVEQIRGLPNAEMLPPWEVYTHPYVEKITNSPFVFVRKMVSDADLKTYAAEGLFDKDECAKACENQSGGCVSEILEDQPIFEYDIQDLNLKNQHDLLWCWTNDGMFYAVVDQKFLVMAKKSYCGHCELLALRNYPQTREHYGISEIMLIIEEQKLLNDLMGMGIDGIHISGNPMFKVKKGAMPDWKRVVFRPGGHVPVETMDDVEPFQVAPLLDQVLGFVEFISSRMKTTTGTTDELAGTGSQQKTATGLVRLQDAAGVRVKNKTRLFMPSFQDFYERLFVLNAMYLDYEVALRIIGPDGAEVFKRYQPRVFSVEVDVEVELSNTMESGPEAVNKWLNILKAGGMDPMLNRQTMWERIFRAMGERRLRPFFASSAKSQADALDDIKQVMSSGYIAEAQPGDNHQVHLQVKQMFMATPVFAQFAQQFPVYAQSLTANVGQHQMFMQQQMQANQQMQQTQSTDQGQGAVLPEANDRANAMFNMGQTGADQGGGGF